MSHSCRHRSGRPESNPNPPNQKPNRPENSTFQISPADNIKPQILRIASGPVVRVRTLIGTAWALKLDDVRTNLCWVYRARTEYALSWVVAKDRFCQSGAVLGPVSAHCYTATSPNPIPKARAGGRGLGDGVWESSLNSSESNQAQKFDWTVKTGLLPRFTSMTFSTGVGRFLSGRREPYRMST